MKLKRMFDLAVAEGRSAQHATAKKIAEEVLAEVEKALAAVGRAGFDASTNLSAVDKMLSVAGIKLDAVVASRGLMEDSTATKVVLKTLELLVEVAQLEYLRRLQLVKNFQAKNAPKEPQNQKKAKK